MPTMLATFRDQIARAVKALNFASSATDVHTLPVRIQSVSQHDMANRYSSLKHACQLLLGEFDELDFLMDLYLEEVPLSRRTALTDAENFLEWLTLRVDLTDEQRDAVVCQQSRHSVEFVAVKQRLAHARFQELLSNNQRLATELGSNRTISVHFNPAHIWATLETRVFLDDEATIPATVLFFAVGDAVEGAVIEADLIPLLQQLKKGAARVNQLTGALAHYTRQDLLDILRELAQLGIIALA